MGLRFGDFELDVRAGELRKHGLKIRLPDQSLRVLDGSRILFLQAAEQPNPPLTYVRTNWDAALRR